MGAADGPLATSAEIENAETCCMEHKDYKGARTTAKLSKVLTNTFVQCMLGARAYAVVTHTCKNAQCVEETDRHAMPCMLPRNVRSHALLTYVRL
jgi:hypothetical protein